MALQVWLPLNGTLENKGINQCTFINSGAVINDNGKIGQCYDITNGSIYCPNFSLSNTTFSVFCWVKFTSFANNNNAYMVSLSNQGTTAEEIQFFLGIYKASANDYAQISINLGSNKFGQLYTDTWYHIGLTCQNNTVLIYLNGQYIGTRNISAYAQQHLVIGGRSIYLEFLQRELIDRIFLTTYFKKFDNVDTYIPDLLTIGFSYNLKNPYHVITGYEVPKKAIINKRQTNLDFSIRTLTI